MSQNSPIASGRDDAATTVPASPLYALHSELGASFANFEDHPMPAQYGDPEREVERLRNGCGVVDRGWASLVSVTGADRTRFLNGLVTCDLAALGPGEGAYGFFTQVKGRVLADATFLQLEDPIWLELPAGHAEAMIEHMTRYRIADQVDFESITDAWVPLTVIGPNAASVLADASLPATPWRHRETEVLGTTVRVVREGRFGVPAWTLWVAAREAEVLMRALIETEHVSPVGHQALETVRVEQGRPRFGVDFGRDSFPQETGIEDEAVSYTKGCYLGQEVVARIHYRGGVQRHLRGVRPVDAAADDTVNTDGWIGGELLLDERPVGRVTSATSSSRLGVVGLATIHRKGAEPGSELTLNGARVTVVALPF